MINEQDTYQQIEQFLDGSMSTQEKVAFQSQIDSSTELQSLVDQHKSVQNYVQAQGLVDFKSKLASGMPKASSRSNTTKYVLIGAFSLISLVGLFFVLRGSSDQSSEKETSEIVGYSSEEEDISNMEKTDTNKSVSDIKQSSSLISTKESNKVIEESERFNKKKESESIVGINKRLGTGNDIENNKDEIASEENVDDESINIVAPIEESKDCDKFDPRGDLKERASFNSMGEGKIEITNQNKKESYFIYIDENTRQKDDAVFEHLEHGSYQVSIESETGCVYIKKYTLTTKKVD